MPLDTSIPLQAKAPESNPLAMLLQVSQYKYLNQNADKVRQDMESQNALGQLIQKNTGADGKVNLSGVMADAANTPAAAYGMKDYVGTNLRNQGQQIENGTAQIGQNNAQIDNYKKAIGFMTQQFSSLDPSDPNFNAKLLKIGSDAVEQGHVDPNMVVSTLQQVPQDPNARTAWFKQKLNSLQDVTAQLDNFKPQAGAINIGGKTILTNTDKLTGKVTQTGAFDNTLAPGQQETVASDQLGNLRIDQRDPHGNFIGTRPVPGSYNPTAGGAPGAGPVTLPPGGAGDIDAVQTEVAAARQAANNAPVMRDLNRSIISEVDKGLNTGSLGRLTQRVASATGYNLGSQSATDYNVLGKMLERSAIAAAQSMGPQTNAGLEAQIRANGSLEYTPQAIRKIAVMNDALNTGAENYRTGLEKAITAAGGNQLVKRQFDQQWAQNFDPRVMRLQNASQSGDKKEIDAILKEVGGQNSRGARDLLNKAQKLDMLISQGHM